ncbi:hypothetical protein ACM2LY_25130, partial [Escherichia coli]
SDPGPVFHTIVSIKNDGHYFCRAGGNRPDGLNEPVTKFTSQPQHVLAYNVPAVFETGPIIKRNIKLAHTMRKSIFFYYVNSKD